VVYVCDATLKKSRRLRTGDALSSLPQTVHNALLATMLDYTCISSCGVFDYMTPVNHLLQLKLSATKSCANPRASLTALSNVPSIYPSWSLEFVSHYTHRRNIFHSASWSISRAFIWPFVNDSRVYVPANRPHAL